jgi:HD-GYP domain-containing protein (c-di-GMP phosphodiesterase class II)
MHTTTTFAFDTVPLEELPFEEKLITVHERVRCQLGLESIGRISVASYDDVVGNVSVFAFSDALGKPLRLYSMPLRSVPSLEQLATSGRARVIGDLRAFGSRSARHSVVIREKYRSSLTIPIKRSGVLYGFLFFNSNAVDFFTETVVQRILPYAQLLAAVTVADLDRFRTLKAAVKTAYDIGNHRDDETAGHLRRMAAYTRLIATGLASKYDLSERWVDMAEHFAPMHDVGKIAIPDHILLKPARLDPAELDIMRTHVDAGISIVDALLDNFHISEHTFGAMLRNIVACHHETLDGRGYPHGLAGDAIPIEARIVSVADVFDALTSERPYKHAWSVDEALDHLRGMAGVKVDGECVGILAAHRGEIAEIMGSTELVEQPVTGANAGACLALAAPAVD